MKVLSCIPMLLVFSSIARADTIIDTSSETLTTTETVIVSVGCWNPATCSNPNAYWQAWGIATPAVEPAFEYFAPYGETAIIDWNDPPDWFGVSPGPIATPEPATWVLVALGLIAQVKCARFQRERP